PFKTSNVVIQNREGILIHYRDESSKISCWSEASPLPGFSSESLTDIIETSGSILLSISELKNLVPDLPSLSFAVDCLLWRIFTLKTQAHRINNKANVFIPITGTIPVNAVIGNGNTDKILDEVKRCYKMGFRTFKFKVGLDYTREDQILAAVHSAWPDARIRLDANRAWSYDDALRILSQWKRFNPEYCEEPVTGGICEDIAEIRRLTGIKIAADESVRDSKSARKLTENGGVDFLILKPSLIGGFNEFFGIIKLAQKAGLKIIITTSLESAVGRTWVYAMASTVNSGYAMGLATGHLFEYDLFDDSSLFTGGHLSFETGLLYNVHPEKKRHKDLLSVWQS
ncbi:MAG: o-succinylbenzoate synthase, partial [Cyclonatronaceae bacterium]